VAGPPFGAGAFIWCRFPFGPPERPDRPGPARHIAYVLATADRGAVALLAYTSSGRWRPATRTLPAGVIEFNAEAAGAVGQKPFHLDLRCLARVPITPEWFPDLDLPSRGTVGVAGKRLQNAIQAEARRLAERSPHIIEVRGIPRRR
jgi:hypothetical protein